MDSRLRWLSLGQPAVLGICAAVAILAAACASAPDGPPEADRAAQEAAGDTITTWLAAVSAGDGPRACPLMTDEAQAQLTANLRGGDCAAAVRTLPSALGPAGVSRLRAVSLGPVTLDGTRASAVIGGGTVTLRRRDGQWLIDDLAAVLRTGDGGAFPPPTGFVPSPPATTR